MTLPYKVFGQVEDRSAKVMVLMAGFPDSEMSAFSRVIPEFVDEYRVVSICMSGMDCNTVGKGNFGAVGWGHSFSDLPDLLQATIDEAIPTKDCKYVLVGHDWVRTRICTHSSRYPPHLRPGLT
jgi:pimeloyl-ACP methyl ester carboxylesterase